MGKRYKGANQPPSLIMRLLGPRDYGWQPKVREPPPAIQIEAADELRRLENSLQLHLNFLVSKKLLAEFVSFAEPKRPNQG